VTIKEVFKTGRVPVKIWTGDIESSARTQLENLSTLPFIHSHVAVMPDVHFGMGSTVGSVIPTIDAIVPAAVGVDIGCGMMAHKLNIRPDQLPDNLLAVRTAIEANIPHGRTDNGGKNDRGAWGQVPESVGFAWNALAADSRLLDITENNPKMFSQRASHAAAQLGTLGTGNHFVEVCLDKENGVWLMLHSGSRGIGNRIGSYFITKAKELMEAYHIVLPDPNLAYIPEAAGQLFTDYWKALSWAQDYAKMNREVMMGNALAAVSETLGLPVHSTEMAVNCHHNYVSKEHHFGRNVYLTRKGAVSAYDGDLGIIPGSMGARSFIVRGLGNPESFCSCSHGAGRRMSRTEAHKQFTADDLAAQTEGVECRKDSSVVDEIPSAYKDIAVVMENQSDLVAVVAELKQVLCVKG
jgi:tRNA-splicing ligase RtcB (3'-phosphate/5'-hydroxy nucleic acid ligase)